MGKFGFSMGDINNPIAALVIADKFQGSESVQEWLGHDTDHKDAHLINRQGGSQFLKQQSNADEKEMSHDGQGHMKMPAAPTARFIMVKTDLTFAFFKQGFDGPAQAAEPNQFGQGEGGGCIAKVIL